MKSITKIVLAVLSIAILVFLVMLFFSYPQSPKEFVANRTFSTSENLFFTDEITKYPSQVEITKSPQFMTSNLTLGVVVDPWNLNFGAMPGGGTFGTRFVVLTNMQEKEVKVKLKAYGNISPMVNFSKNNFILGKNENITIDVFLRTSNVTLPGNYTGEIDVIISRPRYDFAYALLKWS